MSSYANLLLMKLTENKLYIGAAIVLLVVSGIMCYYYYQSTNVAKANDEYNQTSNDGGDSAEMMLFYADWCPHCKTCRPIWESVKSEYQGKNVNGYILTFKEINSDSPEADALMNKYGVDSFPTIKLIKGGQVIDYDATPSKDTLDQFINTMV